jgi:hypothetical protein
MLKHLIILLSVLGLALSGISGCTSKQSSEDEVIAGESTDATAIGDAPEEALLADSLPEDSLEAGLAEPPPPEAPAAEPPPLEEAPLDASTPAEPAPIATSPETSSDAVAEAQPPMEKMEDTPQPKPAASLQKVPKTPWRQGKILLNTVYFARPGDTVASISQMIYGADKSKELKKANPRLKVRDPKPSEKVFYNSPLRPNDEERMLTYYEDNGVTPETYVAQKGDTIQKVGKDLLGYDNGWKEIWPVNSVESKGKLEAGTELRYWRGGASATNMAANNTATGEATPNGAPPAVSGGMNEMPPPPGGDMGTPPAPTPDAPPTDMAGGAPPPPPMEAGTPPTPPTDMTPPPPPEMAGAPQPPPTEAAMNEMPPPPPPEMAPPPPPPPQRAAKQGADQEMDEQTMMTLGLVAVAALLFAGLTISKRRRKQREMDSFNETQVGT